jgi:hypothetical protein
MTPADTQRAQNGFGCPLRIPELARARPPVGAPPSRAPGAWGGFGVLLHVVYRFLGAEEMDFGLSEISNVEIRF